MGLWSKRHGVHCMASAMPTGDITNSDLEMAAEVLGWLVLEAVI